MFQTKLILFVGFVVTVVLPMDSAYFSCPCPPFYDPVCGSTGYTYDNICHLDCWKEEVKDVYMLYVGLCDEAHRGLDIKHQEPVEKYILLRKVIDRCICPYTEEPVRI